MGEVTSTRFPLISKADLDHASAELVSASEKSGHLQEGWLSAHIDRRHETNYLRITKSLEAPRPESSEDELSVDHNDIEEHEDEEASSTRDVCPTTVEYDIIFSPSYQVPVLYFNIKDPHFLFPPTMDTLYRYIVPEQFKAQAESAGVVGGITITDHPITNTPAFFIHPCQTATILQASSNVEDISPLRYLMLWISAMGPCVGLNLPLALATHIHALEISL